MHGKRALSAFYGPNLALISRLFGRDDPLGQKTRKMQPSLFEKKIVFQIVAVLAYHDTSCRKSL